MDPEQIQQLITDAQDAINRGADPAAIDIRIRARTGLLTLAALQQSATEAEVVRHQESVVEVLEQEEASDKFFARGPIRNALAVGANAASFGFADDFLKLLGADETAAGIQNAVEQSRIHVPGSTMGLEIASGLAVPGGALAKFAQTTGRTGKAIAAGGLLGAAGSGAVGFGEAEGTVPERFTEALDFAKLGGVFGAVTGGAGSVVMNRLTRKLKGGRGQSARRPGGGSPRSPGQRVAEDIENTTRTGVTRHINEVRDMNSLGVKAAEEGLNEIEAKHSQILSDNLNDFLDRVRKDPDLSGQLGTASIALRADEKFPSLREMRHFGEALRRAKKFDARDELMSILKREIPDFEITNREFFLRTSIEEALELGLDGGGTTFKGARIRTGSFDNIEHALTQLPPQAHESFLSGVVHNEMQKLIGEQTGGSPQVLRKLLDNVQAEGSLRALFDNDAMAEGFIRLLQDEVGLARLKDYARKAGIAAALAAGLGIARG